MSMLQSIQACKLMKDAYSKFGAASCIYFFILVHLKEMFFNV